MKVKRQVAIRRIIEKNKIKTQNELLKELSKMGIKATQASLSRDLAELDLKKQKRSGFYAFASASTSENAQTYLHKIMEDLVKSVEASGNLVIVKTSAGGAQSVAAAIDNVKWQEVLATVAGDDTILIVLNSETPVTRITKRIRNIMK